MRDGRLGDEDPKGRRLRLVGAAAGKVGQHALGTRAVMHSARRCGCGGAGRSGRTGRVANAPSLGGAPLPSQAEIAAARARWAPRMGNTSTARRPGALSVEADGAAVQARDGGDEA